MKKALLFALLVLPLAGCDSGGPSFQETCESAGHIYRDKSQSDMKYVYSVTDGKFHWVLVSTDTELCLDENSGSVIDVQVS